RLRAILLTVAQAGVGREETWSPLDPVRWGDRGLQEPTPFCHANELVQFVLAEGLAEPLSKSGANRGRLLLPVELHEQEVFFLAQVKELAGARILDHVVAVVSQRTNHKLRPADRK